MRQTADLRLLVPCLGLGPRFRVDATGRFHVGQKHQRLRAQTETGPFPDGGCRASPQPSTSSAPSPTSSQRARFCSCPALMSLTSVKQVSVKQYQHRALCLEKGPSSAQHYMGVGKLMPSQPHRKMTEFALLHRQGHRESAGLCPCSRTLAGSGQHQAHLHAHSHVLFR